MLENSRNGDQLEISNIRQVFPSPTRLLLTHFTEWWGRIVFVNERKWAGVLRRRLADERIEKRRSDGGDYWLYPPKQ